MFRPGRRRLILQFLSSCRSVLFPKYLVLRGQDTKIVPAATRFPATLH